MRPFWVDLRAIPVQKRIGFLRAAREAGADAIVLAEDGVQGIEGNLIVAAQDGTLLQGGATIGAIHALRDARATQQAASQPGIVVAVADGWEVIPLETLVAARRDRPGTLFGWARSPERVALQLGILATGVHGIVLAPEKPADILDAGRILAAAGPAPTATTATAATGGSPSMGHLVAARVTDISDAGMAERVCIDAATRFDEGQGLAVGATAASLVAVHAETLANPHIEARPFRVNAGAVHHYTLGPGGSTRYLSELQSGEHLVGVDRRGGTFDVLVGRCKIERRPHTLLRWLGPSGPGHAFLQTAETVHLVSSDGAPRSVMHLKIGDSVLVWEQSGNRHTGKPIDAEVIER